MRPVQKLLIVSALAVIIAVGLSGPAPAASALVEVVGAAGVCGCCPATCAGGTYWGCWSSPEHPENGVTCIYLNSQQQHFNCLSCLNTATPATADKANHLQSLDNP